MPTTRIVRRKKYYNEDDDSVWVEVSLLVRLITEEGSGKHFQRRFFRFLHEDADLDRRRTEIKRIVNPDDPSMSVPIPVTNQIVVEAGYGRTFNRYIIRFDNSENNACRKTHVKTVTGKDDATSRLDVEVIERICLEMGYGRNFNRVFLKYEDQGEEINEPVVIE